MSAGTVERCSTCGRTPEPTNRFFRARAAEVALTICAQCVEDASNTIAEGPTRIPGAAYQCNFCKKTEEQVDVIVGIGPSLICDECVDAYKSGNG